MLGLQGVKGTLESGADADIVILGLEETGAGERKLDVEQVWKFGQKVFVKDEKLEKFGL